jgi:lysosomal acid lipase/cholesteryl ester hydrolase
MIAKIQDITKQMELFYAGHSMGTTSFMVMANKRPELQKNIKLASFLAPIAYVDHMTSPLHYIAPFVNSIDVSR